MNTAVVTALVTVFGGLAVAAASYWFTKQRERDAEWRKEKLGHYKAFIESLSGIMEGESTPEGQRAFARAVNNLRLFAPQEVISALDQFKEETKASSPKRTLARHDALLTVLLLAIRKDLNIRPPDNPASFKASLWASGVNASRPEHESPSESETR